ncbi:MAG: glutamate--tRNA ligase [Thermodesulfovibrionales bacterium]|nr:glutamate--tRNA ligase [Thermodesulfovibrionales bacterium]
MIGRVRVRFAPSPTGHLHIGGARTALFNWLFARHYKGAFVLRIEDTDKSRSTDEYIELIIEAMNWLGLDWDEGPYRQTDRFNIYREYAEKLVKDGKAYYCICSPEELEAKRRLAATSNTPIGYDRKCRDLEIRPGIGSTVIRFKMPLEGETVVNDLIKGKVVFENSQLEDFVIIRSDGTPTYNFAVVVDDIDMKISHVIRGDDHLNNTPKQIHIYEAFDTKIPEFAHLPMILGPDKSRLSKRHGATSVLAYKELGYLPEAIINYLARLGWSHGDQEIFTKDELIAYFSIENIGKSAAIFNPDKLLWLNSQYMLKGDSLRLAQLVKPFLKRRGIIYDSDSIDIEWLSKAVELLKGRSKTLDDLANSLNYFFVEDIHIDPRLAKDFFTQEGIKYLSEVSGGLSKIDSFTKDEIAKVFEAIAERNKVKLGAIAQPVRVAITGGTASPGIFELIEVLGKEKVIKRLSKIVESPKIPLPRS